MKRGLLRFKVQCSKCTLGFLCSWSFSRHCLRFFFSYLPKSWWKMLLVSWSMSGKYSTVEYLLKCCFQCVSYLLERNFEHSCDQVTFKMPLSKKMPWHWRKSFSSKRPFLPLVLNKNNNNKHAEYHGIFILFKVQIYWKQGSHISLLFGTGLLLNHFSCLEEANISTVNTNLIKFVGDQRLHKNIKWIMCF